MPNENAGTPPEGGEAQSTEAAAAAAATGTPNQPDEVTTLRSRNAGLDAKVTSLTVSEKAAIARAEAAEARALALADEKTNGDTELRAELERIKGENAQIARDAALARIEAKYPETFGTLGEAAANLTADVLAATEARLAGVTETSTPGTAGANAPRVPAGSKSVGDMTVAELMAEQAKQFAGSVFDTKRD